MTTSLYDLYLGDVSSLQGYRCRSFTRDSAPLIASKFSTGSQGQTDLDLLKSASVDNLSGGMFQRDHRDPKKAARAIGVYNRYDDQLYPSPPRSTATAVPTNYVPRAKAESELVSFMVYAYFSAGVYSNRIDMVTPGGGISTLTGLPATLASNGFSSVTGAALHKKYLFLASTTSSGGVNCYRYDYGANTWQDVGWNFCRFATMRGVLYAIGPDSAVCAVTNETIAGNFSFTVIDYAGSSDPNDVPIDMVEFNGALWIAKFSGLYRFDGAKAVKVLGLKTNQLCTFNGALYFFSGQWLYRFDGTNVVRLQFFGNQEYAGILALTSSPDYLFINTVVLTSGYTQSDKIGLSATGLKRVYAYDGAAFYMLWESAETVPTTFSASLLLNGTRLYDFLMTQPASLADTNRYLFDLSTLYSSSAVTTTSKLEVTSSEFDDGFPNVFKTLEVLEANYTGMIVGDTITVSYQLYDGKTWGSWVTAGTITSTTTNAIEITDATKKLYKRMKVNVTATLAAGSTLALKGVSWRYTLQPRARWRWQTSLVNSSVKTRDNVDLVIDANALSNTVTKSIKQKTPLFMLAPDFGQVKTSVGAAALSFIVKGQIYLYTDPYSEYPLCAVKNSNAVWEILRVATAVYSSGSDETTVTVLERGYYGVTAATIAADAEFHLAYKVYVTRLLREQTILDETTYDEQTTGESQLQREFLLEITEV
jgi:hypothetical protein